MKKYKVVAETQIEDTIFNRFIIKAGIKSLNKAKEIANNECECYFNNPYYSSRDDGLDEYHYWKVYDEETQKCIYEAY